MRIIGIDPGLAGTGYGIIDAENSRLTLVTCGVVKTSARQPTPERLKEIFSRISALVEEFKPDWGAVEEVFIARNIRIAFQLGQAKAAATVAIAAGDIPVLDYPASKVKLTVTGYGRADKEQVQAMVKRLLNLPAVPKPDHAADALAIAICHFNNYRLTSLISRSKPIPKTNK